MLKITYNPDGKAPELWKSFQQAGIFCVGLGLGAIAVKYRPALAPQLAPWVIGWGLLIAVLGAIKSRRRPS
jgi:hypothetical protein